MSELYTNVPPLKCRCAEIGRRCEHDKPIERIVVES